MNLNLTYQSNPELYKDYKKCIEFLSSIKDEDYSYPEEVTYFHVYTEVRTPKELMAIKSYVATQNLEKTKLIVWSDYDITEQENIQPYKDLVEFRVYSPEELAKGTPLEGNSTYLNATDDGNHWMSSGVMRFLVLYKFGGIYYDMDTVLIRDFKPLLGRNFAVQWGGSTDFGKVDPFCGDSHGPCAALLGANKGGQYIEDCMEAVLTTPIRHYTTCFDEDMMARVYRKNPNSFTIFPSPFFDTEWQVSKTDRDLAEELDKSLFDAPLQSEEHLFLDSFAWHWHNSSNKNKDIVEGSKFYLLEQLTNRRLQDETHRFLEK
jgi:hypothetical protein